MKVKKLFYQDTNLSLLMSLLFLWSGVSFFEHSLLKLLCLFHVAFAFTVWARCRGIYDKYSRVYLKPESSKTGKTKDDALLQKAEQEKYWKAVLLKNIVEAAEFLAITVWGAFLLAEDRNGLSELAVYMLGFWLLVPRLIQFAEVVYYLKKYRPKGRSFLGFYCSEDGKNAYGNLRQE